MTATITPGPDTSPAAPTWPAAAAARSTAASAAAARMAALVYRTSSRIVRTTVAAPPSLTPGARPRRIAAHVIRRDAAWRHLAAHHPAIARLVVEEDACVQRLRARRELGEDAAEVMAQLATVRASLRNQLDDLLDR